MTPDNSTDSADIVTASQILGLPVETLRKRLQRGRENGFKADDGTWRVVLDKRSHPRQPAGPVAPADGGRLRRLEHEVAELRAEARALRDDLSRLARHLGEAQDRVAALESRPDAAALAEQAGQAVEARIKPTLLAVADMLSKAQQTVQTAPAAAVPAIPAMEPRKRRSGLFARRDRDDD